MAGYQTLATLGVKPGATPAATKPAAAPSSSPFAPIDTRAIMQQAHAQALNTTRAITQGIQAQQQSLIAQSQQQAADAQKVGSAAANTLSGMDLGGKLSSAYRTAGQDQAGIASGFTGQLGQTVGNEAAQANRALAALGAPGSVQTNVGAAKNTVYALGGAIPANQLVAQAPLAVQNAQGAVKAAAGLGTQAAFGILGAGKQAAAKYAPQIAAAEAKLPALTDTYANRLLTQAQKSRQDAITDYYKGVQLQQAGDKAAADKKYHDSMVAARDAAVKEQQVRDAKMEAIASRNADTSREQANTARYRAHHPSTSTRGPKIIGDDKTGHFQVTTNPDGTITTTPLPGRLGKPVAATPGKTPGGTSTATIFKNAVTLAAKGFAPKGGITLGNKTVGATQVPFARQFQVVLNYLVGSGIKGAQAKRLALQAMGAGGYGVPGQVDVQP